MKDICDIEGCGQTRFARQWCQKHYGRWWRLGDPSDAALKRATRKPKQLCSVDGCNKPRTARGLCPNHYQKMRRGTDGPPGPCRWCGRQIPETRIRQAVYCSDDCRVSAKNTAKRRREGKTASGRVVVREGRTCVECGTPLPLELSRNQVVCSVACRRRRNARFQRDAILRAKYGMGHEEYMAKFKAQGWKCLICGRVWDETMKPWTVDHDHGTGKVRGILCQNCNAGIGMLGDDPATLRAALRYLKV